MLIGGIKISGICIEQHFVKEKTRSATMINLDGRWEHDFVNNDPVANDKISIK
ncbi:MAG: hypothetical protein PHP51_04510 [Desulfotomaculaceae bacterium]|nr:hypothetical protein [Desulfotomaculaceae bacterium]MDD4767205.1 hypothetical protein [Desulfotomaculaceae bacterium]